MSEKALDPIRELALIETRPEHLPQAAVAGSLALADVLDSFQQAGVGLLAGGGRALRQAQSPERLTANAAHNSLMGCSSSMT